MSRGPRQITQADVRAMARARWMVSQLMKEQNLTSENMNGVSPTAMRWFLHREGNPTITALSRMLNALGYELKFGITKLKVK